MIDDAPDMTAAELALGVLDGPERAAALRRVLAEPDFAAEVARWRERLSTLLDDVPAVEPGPDLLARVERTIDVQAAPTRGARWWPAVAGLTSLAAAALLAILVARPEPVAPPTSTTAPTPAPLLAAAIAPTAAGEPLSAVWDPAAGTLRLSAASLTGPRRSAQLWVIGGDGVPHPLGLLDRAGRTMLTPGAADRARLTEAAVLAISAEPLGGSPTGKPTGPIVAKGTLART